MTTKLSASLPDEDVDFLDEYRKSSNPAKTRSAALHEAIVALRRGRDADDYLSAYDEFTRSGDADAWDPTAGDSVA